MVSKEDFPHIEVSSIASDDKKSEKPQLKIQINNNSLEQKNPADGTEKTKSPQIKKSAPVRLGNFFLGGPPLLMTIVGKL